MMDWLVPPYYEWVKAAHVRNLSFAPTQGSQDFIWDGLDDRGTAVPAGTYSFSAVANVGGANQALEVLLSGRVSSVSLDASGAGLTLNTAALGPLSLANVRRVM